MGAESEHETQQFHGDAGKQEDQATGGGGEERQSRGHQPPSRQQQKKTRDPHRNFAPRISGKPAAPSDKSNTAHHAFSLKNKPSRLTYDIPGTFF